MAAMRHSPQPGQTLTGGIFRCHHIALSTPAPAQHSLRNTSTCWTKTIDKSKKKYLYTEAIADPDTQLLPNYNTAAKW
jgi:hypothetical protein